MRTCASRGLPFASGRNSTSFPPMTCRTFTRECCASRAMTSRSRVSRSCQASISRGSMSTTSGGAAGAGVGSGEQAHLPRSQGGRRERRRNGTPRTLSRSRDSTLSLAGRDPPGRRPLCFPGLCTSRPTRSPASAATADSTACRAMIPRAVGPSSTDPPSAPGWSRLVTQQRLKSAR